jgi:hypothetical protein
LAALKNSSNEPSLGHKRNSLLSAPWTQTIGRDVDERARENTFHYIASCARNGPGVRLVGPKAPGATHSRALRPAQEAIGEAVTEFVNSV